MPTADPHPFADFMARHAPEEGHHHTALDGLILFRRDSAFVVGNIIYTPSICVVLQGRKVAKVGGESLFYDADNYLVTSVPLPVVAEILGAGPEAPFLSLVFELDLATVRRVLYEGRGVFEAYPPPEVQRGLAVSAVTSGLRGATQRLLGLLDRPEDVPVLAPLVIQEIIYEVLKGPQGGFLRALAQGHGQERVISDVLTSIHADPTQAFHIPSMAAEVGMSESVFYEAFKTVTSASPLQYIKRLRLMEAYRRLTSGWGNVSEAAYEVGYNSPSQFSREFKRLFGVPPSALEAGVIPEVRVS